MHGRQGFRVSLTEKETFVPDNHCIYALLSSLVYHQVLSRSKKNSIIGTMQIKLAQV
jgi:hypothetical protein